MFGPGLCLSTFSPVTPNSFTPDNDGLNDVFKAEGADLRGFDAHFNRWGEVISERMIRGALAWGRMVKRTTRPPWSMCVVQLDQESALAAGRPRVPHR